MNLALNNLVRLICHKTQQTNQPTTLELAMLLLTDDVVYKGESKILQNVGSMGHHSA